MVKYLMHKYAMRVLWPKYHSANHRFGPRARAWSTESKIDTMADVAKAGRWRRVRGRGRGVTTS